MRSLADGAFVFLLSTLAWSCAAKTGADGAFASGDSAVAVATDSAVALVLPWPDADGGLEGALARADAARAEFSSAPTNGDGAGDTKPVSGCDQVLIRSTPSGLHYPPVYSWPAGTEKKLDDALDGLFASTDTERGEWTVDRAAITLVPTLKGPVPWSRVPLSDPVRGILIPQDDPNELVTRAAIRLFLDHLEVFLGQAEAHDFQVVQIAEEEEQCGTIKLGLGEETHEACTVRLQQKYCGLELGSDEYRYRGDVDMSLHRSSRRLWQIFVNVVPYFPVYTQTPLSAADVRAKLVGIDLPLGCPGGSVRVEETTSIETQLGVFVRPSTNDTTRLEYRTAFKAEVTTGALSWNVWVDGFDGTVLMTTANFICN